MSNLIDKGRITEAEMTPLPKSEPVRKVITPDVKDEIERILKLKHGKAHDRHRKVG